jgi:hypothetical protein
MPLARKTVVLLGVAVVGLVAIGVDAVWKQKKDGEIVVFAPPDAAARVRIDGGEPIDLKPGEIRRLQAGHGAHDVQVEVPQALQRQPTLESGRQSRGVPTLATQCFAELDVTLSHFGESAGKEPPKVLHITEESDVFEVPGPFALSEAELPDHLTDKVNSDGEIVHVQLQQLFRAVPCTTKDDPQAALRFLGYVR